MKSIDDSKKKIQSESTGWENLGKFYKHIRSKQKIHTNIGTLDIALYMLLVEYSFGYTNDIRYEISISISKIMKELNTKTNKAVILSLKRLQELDLIKRIKGQNVGPKQAYRYMVMMPKGYHIQHKEKKIDHNDYRLPEKVCKHIDTLPSKEALDQYLQLLEKHNQGLTKLQKLNAYAYFNKEEPVKENKSIEANEKPIDLL